MPLAHPTSAGLGPRTATTALGYADQPLAGAANDARCPPTPMGDDAVARVSAAVAAAVVAVTWLEAIARIAALYG
jgi:hypothetical protein